MNENREAYEELADRAVRLLAAVANTISKSNPEKLKGMEGNVAGLLLCVLDHIIPVSPDIVEQNAPKYQTCH
jgi:hypothetical protein